MTPNRLPHLLVRIALALSGVALGGIAVALSVYTAPRYDESMWIFLAVIGTVLLASATALLLDLYNETKLP